MEYKTVSMCASADWCRGYNKAVKEANIELDGKDVEIMRLKHKLERLKAVADAALNTVHNLGEDHARVLKEMHMLASLTTLLQR